MFPLVLTFLIFFPQPLHTGGCNVMANTAVKVHKLLLQHPLFPTAVDKGRATRTSVLVCAVTCLHIGGPDCCSPTFLVSLWCSAV